MKEVVIVCVGSDKVSGDALGPTVGSLLIEKYNVNAYVYGKIGNTVNSSNIDKYVAFLEKYHKRSLVIAVDACVGKREEIGKIKITEDGVSAGLAVGRKKSKIGNFGVLGVVCQASDDNLSTLLETPYDLVYGLADDVAKKVLALI